MNAKRGRPTKVTDDQARAAYLSLKARGEPLNGQRLRMELGGGSQERYAMLIAGWEAEDEGELLRTAQCEVIWRQSEPAYWQIFYTTRDEMLRRMPYLNPTTVSSEAAEIAAAVLRELVLHGTVTPNSPHPSTPPSTDKPTDHNPYEGNPEYGRF